MFFLLSFFNNLIFFLKYTLFYNLKLYTFDKLEINYKLKFIDRFTYNFTKGVTGVNLSEYQPDKLGEMLKNTPYINIIEIKGIEYIFIEWDGLKNFIKSKRCLEKSFTQREFLKLLEIKDDKFKQQRTGQTNLDDNKNNNKDDRVRGLLLTIPKFYKYFLNKKIKE